MSEQNPQVRRPQTLNSQEQGPATPQNGPASGQQGGPPSGMRGAAATYGLNNRPSGIRPLPVLPPAPSVQFAHFGLLNAGEQSKGTLFTAGAVNVTLAIIICLLGAAAKKVHDQHVLLTHLDEPIPVKKQEEEKPKPKPPVPKIEPPKPIELPKIEPPKIQVVKLDMPKPPTPVVKMAVPVPILAAAPLKVNAPAAPKLLNNLTKAASVANNDAHPTPVMMGTMNNPLKTNPNSRTTMTINMGSQGVPGMAAGNTGHGPKSLTGSMGSGAPNGYSTNGTAHAAVAIKGIAGGQPGGTGTGRSVSAVNIAPMVVQQQRQPAVVSTGVVKPLKLTGKLNPACTQDAKNAHIEGQVILNVNFAANGTVQVLGVARGLGHGLDQSAEAAAQQMRFEPETLDGRPVDKKEAIGATFACAPQ